MCNLFVELSWKTALWVSKQYCFEIPPFRRTIRMLKDFNDRIIQYTGVSWSNKVQFSVPGKGNKMLRNFLHKGLTPLNAAGNT
jgi:hypothetical protein